MREVVRDYVASVAEIGELMQEVSSSLKGRKGPYIIDLKKKIELILSLVHDHPKEDELMGICNWRLYEEGGNAINIMNAGEHGLAPSFQGYLNFCDIQNNYPDDVLLPKIYHWNKRVVWRALEQVKAYLQYQELIKVHGECAEEISYKTNFPLLLHRVRGKIEIKDILLKHPQLEGVFIDPTIEQLRDQLKIDTIIVPKLQRDPRLGLICNVISDQGKNNFHYVLKHIRDAQTVYKIIDNDQEAQQFVEGLGDEISMSRTLTLLNVRKQVIGLLDKYGPRLPRIDHQLYIDQIPRHGLQGARHFGPLNVVSDLIAEIKRSI